MAPDRTSDSRQGTKDPSSNSAPDRTSFDTRTALQLQRLLFGRDRDAAEVDAAALERALERLAALSPRQYRVVKLRLLAGLSVEQAARELDADVREVRQDWRMARAWLRRALGSGGGSDEGGRS